MSNYGTQIAEEENEDKKQINYVSLASVVPTNSLVDYISKFVARSRSELDTIIICDIGRLIGRSNDDIVLPITNSAAISFQENAVKTNMLIFDNNQPILEYSKFIKYMLNQLKFGSLETEKDHKFQYKMFNYSITKHFNSKELYYEFNEQSNKLIIYEIIPDCGTFIYQPDSSNHLKMQVLKKKEAVHDIFIQFDNEVKIKRCCFDVFYDNLLFHINVDKILVNLFDSNAINDNNSAEYFNLSLTLELPQFKIEEISNVVANELNITTIPFDVMDHMINRMIAEILINNCYIVSQFKLSRVDTNAYYYPDLFGDEIALIRAHYNKKKIGSASDSEIEFVRRINNSIKRMMIDSYVPDNAFVLDLACGHAQDLLKFKSKNLSYFIGIDISSQEIFEARRRLKERLESKIDRMFHNYRFYVGNMLQPSSYSKYLIYRNQKLQFDIVNIQLAIHYCLSSLESAENLIKSISDNLKPGGLLIGSCPSVFQMKEQIYQNLKREELTKKESSHSVYTYGNSLYKVEFEAELLDKIFNIHVDEKEGFSFPESFDNNFQSTKNFDFYQDNISLGYGDQDVYYHRLILSDPISSVLNETWGLQYNFWLIDHINASEYVVPWKAFCRVCQKHYLKCVKAQNFQDCVSQLNENFVKNLEKKNQININEQLDCIKFYQIFVFQKQAANQSIHHEDLSSNQYHNIKNNKKFKYS